MILWMSKYKCLKKTQYIFSGYCVTTLRKKDIQKIREWRNNQMDVLRQKKKLTPIEQKNYYNKVISRSFNKSQPEQILLSVLLKNRCIGYGGLVHIDWDVKKAEISFLADTNRIKSIQTYQKDFNAFFELILKIAFVELKLNRLTNETFDIRPMHIKLLEKMGFKYEGKLKQNALVKGKYVDSLIHSYLRTEYIKKQKSESFSKKILIPEKNILVTSISKKVPLLEAIKRASYKFEYNTKIFGADSNENCIGRYFVDEFWRMPKIEKLKIKDFISYCKKNNILFVIPTRDGELTFFAQNKKELLKNKIRVMVSNVNTTEICLDKLLFYKKTKLLGFPTIFTTTNIEEIKSQKYVIKERFGSGSREIGLALGKKQVIALAKNFVNPIYQPYVKGKEFSVDVYVGKNGKTKGMIVRTRECVTNGESQITETVRKNNIDRICKKLAEKLNLYGHVVFQVIIDSNEKCHILECNNRFGGASSISEEVGLDSFYWFLIESVGKKLEKFPFVRSKSNKKQIRYPKDLII